MNFDNLTTALIIIAPTFIVVGGMYMLIKNMLERDYRLKLLEARRLIQKDMLPLKLQAVERMVVFLERIQPENILFRILQPGMNVRDLQVDLLAAIRQEYEHNVSQQVYVSIQSWSLITKAKDDIIATVNLAADSMDKTEKAILLSQIILQRSSAGNNFAGAAILSLKSEVDSLL